MTLFITRKIASDQIVNRTVPGPPFLRQALAAPDAYRYNFAHDPLHKRYFHTLESSKIYRSIGKTRSARRVVTCLEESGRNEDLKTTLAQRTGR